MSAARIPDGQLSLGIARSKRMTGGEMVSAAEEWTIEHPDEWEMILDECRERARNCETFSFRHVCDGIAWSTKVGNPHSITAALCRLMFEEVPEAVGYVRIAKSKADACCG